MARRSRIEYPGATIMSRREGIPGQRIVHDENDQYSLIETLGEACDKTGWLVHAWVLMDNHWMDNHYHAVETPQGNLVVGMRHKVGSQNGFE